MIEIPKELNADVNAIKDPNNRLLVRVLLLGLMTAIWLYITIATSSTADLKKHIEDLELRLIKKNELLAIKDEKIEAFNKAASVKLELENARLQERILTQEQTKAGLRK